MNGRVYLRIDNRLLHGQVVQYWIGHLGITKMIVADRAVAANRAISSIYRMALPQDVGLTITPIHRLPLLANAFGSDTTMVLIKDVYSAIQAVMCGFKIEKLTLGNVHDAPGRTRVTDSVYLSQEESSALARLHQQGVGVEIQTFPGEVLHLQVNGTGGPTWSKR